VLLDPDDEVTKILQNVGKYLPRLESSETMSEHQQIVCTECDS